MSRSMSSIVAFLKDESGATRDRCELMAAGISVVILATLNTVGSKLNAKFDEISVAEIKKKIRGPTCRKPPLRRLSSVFEADAGGPAGALA